MKNIWLKKYVIMLLVIAVIAGMIVPMPSVQAAGKSLSLTQAKKLALAESDEYRGIKSKITLKEVAYMQAVKVLQLKQTNQSTYRWSPMFSFELPEELNFEEESNLAYKPAQIRTQIQQLQQELQTKVYRIYEETSVIFSKAYVYQEKVALEEEQLEQMEKALEKSKGRMLLGLSNQENVEGMEEEIEKLKEQLILDKKTFEIEKEKLGNLLAMDVSSGYLLTVNTENREVPRTALEQLLADTLENHQSYYNAKVETQLALLRITENYNLLEKQYGEAAKPLGIYVQQIKSGQTVDGNTFKNSYDLFLKEIENSWEGEWKILSVTIPKEWLKGETQGVRYIEDKPYALYENFLEYQEAVTNQEKIQKELTQEVKDIFETVTGNRSKYLSARRQEEKSEQELQKALLLNSMGELSYEEYRKLENQYMLQQLDTLDAWNNYQSCFYELDRITCGAVTEYLKNSKGNSWENLEESNKYLVEEDTITGAKYYFRSLVEDQMFEFGIYLPQNMKTNITHYELKVGDSVIGKKTEIDQPIKHLTMTLKENEKVYVRLYEKDEFVDDCEVDPFRYQGELNLQEYVIKEADTLDKKVIGTYKVVRKSEMGLMELMVDMASAEDIWYYAVQNEEGKNLLLEEEQLSVSDSFIYMEWLLKDLETLKILCYNKEKTLKYTAYFDTAEYEIYIVETE